MTRLELVPQIPQAPRESAWPAARSRGGLRFSVIEGRPAIKFNSFMGPVLAFARAIKILSHEAEITSEQKADRSASAKERVLIRLTDPAVAEQSIGDQDTESPVDRDDVADALDLVAADVLRRMLAPDTQHLGPHAE